MTVKFLEIRDRGTTVSAMAMKTVGETPIEHRGLRYAGYGSHTIILMQLYDCKAQNDPYNWDPSNRTMRKAHAWLEQHWDEIASGEVLDVEYIAGEKANKKEPEIFI